MNKTPDNFFISPLRLLSPFLLAAALLLLAPASRAATDTWTGGGGDANWQTGGNWGASPDAPPAATDVLDFGGSTQLANNNNFTAATTFDGLIFDSTAGAFVLSGNSITLAGNTGIVDNSSSLETVKIPIVLSSGTQTIDVSSSGGSLLYSGTFSGTNQGLTISGPGLVTLSGSQTYTGNTIINSGTLTLTGSNSSDNGNGLLASPVITVNSGATLVLSGSGKDPLGFTSGRNALVINDGLVFNNVAKSFIVTLDNQVVMTGGTLGGNGGGSGSTNGAYSWPLTTSGLSAMSDASGNAAVISATTTLKVAVIFTVNRGSNVSGFSPDLIVSGAINNTSAGKTLTITGAGANGGITVFSAPNTYTGLTTISKGIVNYQNATAFGANSAITVSSGATAQVQGGISGGNTTLTLSGAGDTGLGATGALENVSGANSYAGAITLAAASTISSDAGTLTLNGAIGDGGSGYVLTKTGPGTITLGGGNTYTGLTDIQNGVLVVTGSIAESGNVTVDDTQSANPILAGTGNGTSTGVLGNVTVDANAGSNFGTISPGTSGTDTSAGKLTMNSLTMNGGQLDLFLSSTATQGTTYSFINVLGALTLPTSAWTLTANAGATAGVYTVLTAGGATNIGTGGTADLPTVNFVGNPLLRPATYTPSWSSTTSLLLTVGGGAQSIIWTGTAGSGGNAIWDVSTHQNWNDGGAGYFYDGDAVTFNDTGTNTNITIQSGTNGEANVQPGSVTVSATSTNYSIGGNPIISLGGLTKSGGATLTLTGSNSFAGTMNINGGILNVDNAGALGGGGNITFGGGTLQYGSIGQEDVSGQIANSGSAIQIDTSGQSVTYASSLGSSNTGGLIKNGVGTLTLSATETYSGNTIVNSGTLALGGGNSTAGGTLPDSPFITINAGGALVLAGIDTLGFTANKDVLTINDGLLFDNGTLNNSTDTLFNAVTMVGGTIGANSSLFSGNTYAFRWGVNSTTSGSNNLYATSDASGSPAVISAPTQVQQTIIWNVNRGSAVTGFSPDLLVSGVMSSTGVHSVTVTGAGNGGITVFSAANTFTGGYIAANGILNFQNGTAFGTNSPITITTGSSATIQVQGGITGGTNTMTLSGAGDTGLGATGALENVSGNNSYAGAISLTGNTTISSDAGTLSLSGAITGSGFGLTTAGASVINLSGTSTYSGATAVTAGTLNIAGSLNGTSSTTVTRATLEGTGGIATGVVTIGNGSNPTGSAIIEPGAVGAVGTLTTGSSVSLLSDAQFIFNLDSTGGGTGNGSSGLIALSVSLDPSAEFTFNDIASTPGALTMGTMFTAIATTTGLTGTFTNLPNGDIFADDGNIYQASYTPTALTLTVVPEPGSFGFVLLGLGTLIGVQQMRRRRVGA